MRQNNEKTARRIIKMRKSRRVLSAILFGSVITGSIPFPEAVYAAPGEAEENAKVAIDDPRYSRETVLEVDGKPFWYNGIQIRIDKLKDDPNYACSDTELEKLFQIAAADGFTVANSQIRWTDIQPNHTAPASESAFVYGGENADKVYNENPSGIQIQYSDDESKQAVGYVKFNIEDMTQDQIDGAKIRLYNRNSLGSSRKVEIYALEDDDWSSSTLTWNNAPGCADGYKIEGEGTEKVAETAGWDLIKNKNYYDFNVSDFIKNSEWAADGTVSFAIRVSDNVKDEMIKFGDYDDSGTDGIDARPQLVYSDAEEYDFTVLDNAISFAEKAGMKFEVLWFGTDTCTLSTDARVPVHVQMNYQKTLDDDSARSPLLEKSSASSITGVYGYLMCKNDEGLRALEAEVIHKTFDHIATLENADTVIGCQVSNEPGVGRIHGSKKTEHCMCDTCIAKQETLGVSDKEFREITLWEYNNNLAQAVKTSGHPVWTRVNLDESADVEGVAYNEKMREEGRTSIDFIGIDHYRKSPAQLAAEGVEGNQFAQGKNLTMMMELGQKDSRENGLYLAEDVLAALSGGSYVTIYDASSSDGCEIYQYNKNTKTFSLFRGENEKGSEPVIAALGRTNNMLKRIGYDLATKAPGQAGGNQLVYFNSTSNASENYTQNEVLGNKGITYRTEDNGVGIAVNKNENEIALLATKDKNTFIFSNADLDAVESAETGYYDSDDVWQKESSFMDQLKEEDGKVVLSVPAYSCVRIVTKEGALSEPEVVEKAEVRIEAETSYKLSEGLTANVYDDGASGGGWVKVSASAGDSVVISGEIPMDGVYRVDTCYKKSSDRATVQLTVDGKLLGEPIDMTQGSQTFSVASSGEITLTAGTHEFTYTVTDNSGEGSIIPLDYIYLTRVGNYTDISELKELCDRYSMIEQGDFTDESWEKLQSALKNAEAVIGQEEPSQADINTQIQLLQNAYEGLQIKTDKEKAQLYDEMEALLKEAEAEAGRTDLYTAENIQKMEEAIEQAKNAMVDQNDPAISPEYVATALWKLQTAFDEFKKTAAESPDGVLLIDEDFEEISGNFGFDKGASVKEGRLTLTEGMQNEETSVKKFDYTVMGQSSVDIMFEWSSDIPEDRGKTGIDFRDAYGRLIFALCGCGNENTKKYELRYSTDGGASDSSGVSPEAEWQKVELVPGENYQVQVSADFKQKKVSAVIRNSSGKILVSVDNADTTASNLAKMTALSYWTIAKNGTVYPAVQSIDNFKVYGAGDAGEFPLAGKKVIAFGDSIIDGHLYKEAGVVEFTADKEGMVIEENYANNGAQIMFGSEVGSNGLGGTILDCQVLEAAKDGRDPDYIIFDGGTNDAYPAVLDKLGTAESTDTDTFAGAFRATINAMKENWPDAKIIYVAVHKLGARDMDVQEKLHEIELAVCEETGVTVANLYDDCALDTSNDEMRLKYSFDKLDSGNIPIPGTGDSATGTHPNFLAIEEFYVPILSETLRAAESEPEEPSQSVSKKTLEYFLNSAKQHRDNGDADGCVESVRTLLNEAIAEGETVMADTGATREEVMDASRKLMKAIQALDMKAGNKTDLEMAVELGGMIDLGKYVEAGQKEFADALAAAKAVLADTDAMQGDIDPAWEKLTETMGALRLKADKTILEELLNETAALGLDRYTSETAAVFSKALASAQAVFADGTLSEDDQQTVDDAVSALKQAKAALVIKDTETEEPGMPSDPAGSGDQNDEGMNGVEQSFDAQQSDADNDVPKTGDHAGNWFPAAVGMMVALAAAGRVLAHHRKKQSWK